MSTYKPFERSDSPPSAHNTPTGADHPVSGAPANGEASTDGGPLPIDSLSLVDEADLEDPAAYRLVSVDDLDYLHDAIRDAADLLGVTAKGLRQLGVSPEEASASCAAIARHLRDVNTIVFAVGTGFRSQPPVSS